VEQVYKSPLKPRQGRFTGYTVKIVVLMSHQMLCPPVVCWH